MIYGEFSVPLYCFLKFPFVFSGGGKFACCFVG